MHEGTEKVGGQELTPSNLSNGEECGCGYDGPEMADQEETIKGHLWLECVREMLFLDFERDDGEVGRRASLEVEYGRK